MSDTWLATYVLLWIVVAVQSLLLVGALRQLGLLEMRFGAEPGPLITKDGLPRGTPAPLFEAQRAFGGVVSLSQYAGRRLLLAFLSPTCTSCKRLIPHLNEVRREYARDVEVLAICRGMPEVCEQFARLHQMSFPVAIDVDDTIAHSYGINLTPFAYLLDQQGRVLIRGIANDWTQLEHLIAEEGTFQSSDWHEVPQDLPAESQLVASSTGLSEVVR